MGTATPPTGPRGRPTSAGARADWSPSLRLDPRSEEPLFEQVGRHLSEAIAGGRIVRGSRLPSSRSLARDLGVSRMTVLTALDRLRADGYIATRRGSGTYVAEELPTTLLPRPGRPGTVAPPSVVRARYTPPRSTGLYPLPFTLGMVRVEDFPLSAWSATGRAATRALMNGGASSAAGAREELTAAICEYLATSRGLPVQPEQLVLTGSVEESLAFACALTSAAGDPVWVEDPGVPATVRVLARAGATPILVPVDESGFDVEEARRSSSAAAVAVVSPTRHFPSGVAMSDVRRARLLEWVDTSDGWIVEDDFDADLCPPGVRPDALAAADRRGRTVYIGGFSRLLFPVARLGFVVVPPALAEDARALRNASASPLPDDAEPPPHVQLTLAAFMRSGHLARHVRRLRARYEERREALLGALHGRLPRGVTSAARPGSTHVSVVLPAGVRETEVAAQLARAGVFVEGLSAYGAHPNHPPTLLLGFAGYTLPELAGAAGRFLDALAAVLPAGRRGG